MKSNIQRRLATIIVAVMAIAGAALAFEVKDHNERTAYNAHDATEPDVTKLTQRLPKEVLRSDTPAAPPTSAPAKIAEPNLAQRKEEVRANIELWEDRVRTKLQQIDQILAGLDLEQIQSRSIAVRKLCEILDDLDEEALAIIDAHTQVGPDLKLYRQALLQAPDVFRRIAEDLDKRATEKKSTFIKEAYADFAAEARNLATSYETKAGAIDTLQNEIDKKMEFVVESREFITDVRGFLRAIPTDHGLETETLINRINAYIQVFQEAIDAMKGVADSIGGQPQPTAPTDAPEAAPITHVDHQPWSTQPAVDRVLDGRDVAPASAD